MTKRQILSQIAHIYDPLGLVSPVVITAKLIMQKLWTLKIGWDESIPIDLHYRWQSFMQQLQVLNEIEIPRKVISKDQCIVDAHGFADASKDAYGACIYVRSVDEQGKAVLNLLCAKTKVAPLKLLTIPRLELCAAVMLTQLMQKVQKSLNTSFQRVVLWSDSTIVFQWLDMAPRTLQPFVSHRVAQIQAATRAFEWKYVPTEDNPADLLTRGIDGMALKHNELWWHGSRFLSSEEDWWPQLKWKCQERVTEMKIRALIAKPVQNFELLYKYSDLSKLIRIVAYLLRFSSNASKKNELRNQDSLTREELDKAIESLTKISQRERESFEHEIKSLGKGSTVSKHLQGLTPFIDEQGIVRVGGRLRNTKLNYNKKTSCTFE